MDRQAFKLPLAWGAERNLERIMLLGDHDVLSVRLSSYLLDGNNHHPPTTPTTPTPTIPTGVDDIARDSA